MHEKKGRQLDGFRIGLFTKSSMMPGHGDKGNDRRKWLEVNQSTDEIMKVIPHQNNCIQ